MDDVQYKLNNLAAGDGLFQWVPVPHAGYKVVCIHDNMNSAVCVACKYPTAIGFIVVKICCNWKEDRRMVENV
jgi:hypothetical protein